MYYCIPDPIYGIFPTKLNGTVKVSIELSGDYQDASQQASQAMADLFLSWPIILLSAGIALALSFVYMQVSKVAASCIVWFVILLIIGAGFIMGYQLWKKGQTAANSVSPLRERAKAMRGLGIACWGVTLVFICVIIFLRERIECA
jgi:hypothetical protein